MKQTCSGSTFLHGLNVVTREKPGDTVHDTFPPAVIVLFDHVDDRTFLEGQLIFLVFDVVIYGHHCEEKHSNIYCKDGPNTRSSELMMKDNR